MSTPPGLENDLAGAAPEYEFHPLCELFPMISEDELNELADDIKKHGLLESITLYEGKILDGRNRYKAAKQSGVVLKNYHLRELADGRNPEAFVISANIRRRHLTPEKKRKLLEKLIKADPDKSDRQIADTAKVSHHTVGAVRGELEATGQVAQLETTTGKDGKKRRTKKGGSPKGGKRGEKEMITYSKVTDAKTATNAYSVLEQHLLDALQDLHDNSSFAHADEYAQKTIEKLQEKLGQMQPEEEEEEEAT